jgi:hypothetical protein
MRIVRVFIRHLMTLVNRNRTTMFELGFNLQTAKQIGGTIPQTVLFRADNVIK